MVISFRVLEDGGAILYLRWQGRRPARNLPQRRPRVVVPAPPETVADEFIFGPRFRMEYVSFYG